MHWIKPIYSKKVVRKAGKAVASGDFSEISEDEALKIINNWRASHEYLMEMLYIKGRLYGINRIIKVFRRLKRLESIVGKLSRFPNMMLDRMQDLGGCRVIVNKIDDINEATNVFKNFKTADYTLIKENNYIAEPKPDGYRSVHLIFEVTEADPVFQGLKVEVQIRTQLQHAWATAVEILSLRQHVNIKAGEGDAKTRRYMALISALFALEEGAPTGEHISEPAQKIFEEAMQLDKDIHILDTIRAIQMTPIFSGERQEKSAYYVIKVDAHASTSKIYSFNDNQLETAVDFCAEVEKSNQGSFAVLISAIDVNSLFEGYPNYLSNANKFVAKVDALIEKYAPLFQARNIPFINQ
ncbi:MAG: RelA/SpoT domain-containing protein [Defluviitaleaceae bacterium]|nr:RelA/SpoT domain-containing protein [Defluviitaleaceae bacterium]